MTGTFVQLTNAQFSRALSDPSALEGMIQPGQETPVLDVDKSWEAIFFILTGSALAEDPDHPMGRVVFSQQFFDEDQDMGYGPAHYVTPDQVKELNTELQLITDEEVRSRFDGQRMDEMSIYPEGWEEEGSFDYLADNFMELRSFYASAALNNAAVVFFVS